MLRRQRVVVPEGLQRRVDSLHRPRVGADELRVLAAQEFDVKTTQNDVKNDVKTTQNDSKCIKKSQTFTCGAPSSLPMYLLTPHRSL